MLFEGETFVTQLIVCFRKFCELACNGVKYIYIYIYIYIYTLEIGHTQTEKRMDMTYLHVMIVFSCLVIFGKNFFN